MNSFLKSTTTALSFAFCIGLSSCEKDALLTPTAPDPKSADIAPENALQTINPTALKNYTLVKLGQYVLTYQADGRLIKVQKGAKYTTIEYLVNPARIVAYTLENTSFFGNIPTSTYGVKSTTLYLNNDNMAVSSEVETNYQKKGEFSSPQKFAYVYENQRLVKCYNVENPTAHITIFGYNTTGDLTSVKVENNGVLAYVDQYTYSAQANQPVDYHPLNPQFSFFGEEYDEGTALMFLPVFGKFNKHLVQTIARTQNAPYKVLFNYAYKYNLNVDGHVTDRERWNQTLNQKIETDQYQYTLGPIYTRQ